MKILYHKPTGTTKPYNCTDDEPVIGLSAEYEAFELIAPDPPTHDPETHYVRRLPEVIDTEAKTVTRAWEIVERQPTDMGIVQNKRAAMAAAFDALPVAVQAAFWTTRVSAESAMERGRFDIARALIEAQQVPPHLEATKTVILSHFPTS